MRDGPLLLELGASLLRPLLLGYAVDLGEGGTCLSDLGLVINQLNELLDFEAIRYLATSSNSAQALLEGSVRGHTFAQQHGDTKYAQLRLESEVEATKHLGLCKEDDVLLGQVLNDGSFDRIDVHGVARIARYHVVGIAYDHLGALRLRHYELLDATLRG